MDDSFCYKCHVRKPYTLAIQFFTQVGCNVFNVSLEYREQYFHNAPHKGLQDGYKTMVDNLTTLCL